jgi:hypothetical protein
MSTPDNTHPATQPVETVEPVVQTSTPDAQPAETPLVDMSVPKDVSTDHQADQITPAPAETAIPTQTGETIHSLTTHDGARDIPESDLPVKHDPETTECLICPVCQYRFVPGTPRL